MSTKYLDIAMFATDQFDYDQLASVSTINMNFVSFIYYDDLSLEIHFQDADNKTIIMWEFDEQDLYYHVKKELKININKYLQ